MKPLSYPPLFVAIAALQLVVVVAVANVRVFAYFRTGFLLAWSVIVLATVGIGYARREARKGRLAQFMPILFAIASLWLWSSLGATRAAFLLLGLGLLAGRNCVLADRRSLYFDLAIAIAIFFDTVGLQRSFDTWPYALAFLVALVFVLMADYSDRRLAFVHGSHAERSEASRALMPGIANAALATVLVLLVGAFIYWILPQPAPLQYGVPFGEAPAQVYSADARTATGPGGDTAKGGGGQGGLAGAAQAPEDKPDMARLDVSRSGAGIRPAQQQVAMAPGGNEKRQGQSRSSSEGSGQTGQEQGQPQGERRDESQGGSPQRPSQGVLRGESQGNGPAQEHSRSEGSGPAGQQQSQSQGERRDQSQGGGQQSQTQGDQRGESQGGAGQERSRGESSESDGQAHQQTPGQTASAQVQSGQQSSGGNGRASETQQSETSGGNPQEQGPAQRPRSEESQEGTPEPEPEKSDEEAPLMLLRVATRHPLYVRTHVFVDYAGAEWRESKAGFKPFGGPGVWGRWNSDGRFGLVQRYLVLARLDPRLPAAYRMDRVGFPATRMGFSEEDSLRAPAKLEPGTRYNVRSTIQYVDGRASGGFEPMATREVRALPADMPRIIALADELTRGLRTAPQRAAALEKYLRENYRAGPFEARGAEPMQAFLFEQKRGGSEQFASALALLMRASGIPARVVSGYRMRRLNPLHGAYEIWRSDRHYWVEAHVLERWTVYEPTPWAALLPERAPGSAWQAAREYVRLARYDDHGAEVRPPDRPSDAYLFGVLAVGWLSTFGPWVLAALLAFGILAWRRGALVRPILDFFDRARLRAARRLDARARVLAVFRAVEGIFGRRGVRRAAAENHAEYLERAARARPQVAPALKDLAAAFAQARYGAAPLADDRAEAVRQHCVEMLSLVDEFRAATIAK